MPAYIHDDVFDLGLTAAAAAIDTYHICTSQPANFAGIAAVTLGNKAVSVDGPENHASSGRQISVAPFVGGTVTGTGTAAFYALEDGTRLLAAGPLDATQSVTAGNSFSTDADTIVQLKDAN